MFEIFKMWFYEVFVNDTIAPLAMFILLGLSVVVVFYAIATESKKRAFVALSLPFIFYIYAKIHCGICLKDTIVMKPMAEKISAYIVKHGIPERLEDIPDLPYRLEGCEIEKGYIDGQYNKVNNIDLAYVYQFDEKCFFLEHKNKIELSLDISRLVNVKPFKWEGVIEMSSSKGTIYKHYFLTDKHQKIVFDAEPLIGSRNSSGICNPMRQ